MPLQPSTSSPTVSGPINEPIFPSSSPLSSLASSSNSRSNSPTPTMGPAPPPPITTLSSSSPTPPPVYPLIPGYLIKEISDLSDPSIIFELDRIYSIGEWPKSPIVFENSSASLLCLTVFGPRATISAYKQENTILRIYLPKEITNPEGEYVAIRLSSSGLSNDGLFTAAKDAWALYRDEEGVLEALLVKILPAPAVATTAGNSAAGALTAVASAPGATNTNTVAATAGAAASVPFSGENEDEENKEVETKLIRITHGDEEGWMNFLVEINDWKGWVKEGIKREDGSWESGQLHVKVQIVLK